MIGNMIKIKGIDFLVLDEDKDRNVLFVIALNTGIRTVFSIAKRDGGSGNDYMGSILQLETHKWIDKVDIQPSFLRGIDLLTLDGYKEYGESLEGVSPLNINEYRKYADIMIPHIKSPFWLVTGWGRPNSFYSDRVCYIRDDGSVGSNDYSSSIDLVPALWISKDEMLFDLSFVSTEDLMIELSKRLNK